MKANNKAHVDNSATQNEADIKLKPFKFPTFEEWEKKGNKVRVELGAYCCEIRAYSWSNSGTTYMLAASLADRNPLNIYTPQIFCRRFDYDGDKEKLREWYETVTEEFATFFKQLIKTTYLEG